MAPLSISSGFFDHLRRHYRAVAIGLMMTLGGPAGCSVVKPNRPCEVDAYAQAHPRPIPSGLPEDWDKSIPVPDHAMVIEVSDEQESMRRVDFRTDGETYAGLKSFYTDGLTTAGYSVDKSAEEAEDKTMHVWFSACGRHENVFIFPDDEHAKDFDVRIVYVTEPGAKTTDSSTSIKKAYEACAFGDAEACGQVNSGDPTVGAAHDAAIQEQLKSPEQRAKDLGPFHGM